MLSKKIFLSAALVSMTGFVACGDDSSSNSGDGSLPEKVETIDQAIHLNCNEEAKCAMVYVEEVKDNFFCNGTAFEPYSPILNAKDCPTEEDKKEDGKTEGDENKAPESSASAPASTNSGAASADSNTESSNSSATSTDSSTDSANSGATSADSSTDSADSSTDSANSGEVTGPTGDLVSCSYTAAGVMGGTYCDEVAASMQSALTSQCTDLSGTMKTDGGCSQEGVQKKCPSANMNHYVYSGDDTCPTF